MGKVKTQVYFPFFLFTWAFRVFAFKFRRWQMRYDVLFYDIPRSSLSTLPTQRGVTIVISPLLGVFLLPEWLSFHLYTSFSLALMKNRVLIYHNVQPQALRSLTSSHRGCQASGKRRAGGFIHVRDITI